MSNFDRAQIRDGKIVQIFEGEKGWIKDSFGRKKASPVVIGYDDGEDKVLPYSEYTVDKSTTGDRQLQDKSVETIITDETVEKRTTITDKSEQEITEIQAFVQFQESMKLIKAGYTQEEIDTWPQQLEEAKAHIADPADAVTPMLTAYADQAGLTKDALAMQIIEKAEAFALAAGEALGRKKKALSTRN